MAKRPSRTATWLLNSVAMAGLIDDLELDLKQMAPSVQCFGDTGPKRVVDNHDWTMKAAGPADFAAGASDATIFALLANAGVAQDFGPTGAVAGASDPHYTGTVVLESYNIKAANGAPIKFTAGFGGNSALVRAVA